MSETSPITIYFFTIFFAIILTAGIVLGVKFMRDRVNKLSDRFEEDPESFVQQHNDISIQERMQGIQNIIPNKVDISKAQESVKSKFKPKIKAADSPFDQLRENCVLLQNTEEPPTPEEVATLDNLLQMLEQQHPQSQESLTSLRTQLSMVHSDPGQFFLYLIELHKWTDENRSVFSS